MCLRPRQGTPPPPPFLFPPLTILPPLALDWRWPVENVQLLLFMTFWQDCFQWFTTYLLMGDSSSPFISCSTWILAFLARTMSWSFSFTILRTQDTVVIHWIHFAKKSEKSNCFLKSCKSFASLRRRNVFGCARSATCNFFQGFSRTSSFSQER